MNRHLIFALLFALALGTTLSSGQPPSAPEDAGAALRIMTFNVWHGLRSGESRQRFPGEDADRAEKRFAWQIEEIRRLDPDVLLFQEVNPNQPQSRRYAEALGYDEIHKVTSCGLHLGGIYKIPKNVNDGLAILAKPALGLRRAGKKRLSGNAMCSATWGFQTKESRYALFGEITVAGQKVLLATTHLASPSFTPDDFDDRLEKMVESGELTAEQRDEILTARDKKLDRNTLEAQRLLEEIDKRRTRLAGTGTQAPVIFGGDFNAEADRPGIAKIGQAGFTEAASGPAFLTWNPVDQRRELHDWHAAPLLPAHLRQSRDRGDAGPAPRHTTADRSPLCLYRDRGELSRDGNDRGQRRHLSVGSFRDLGDLAAPLMNGRHRDRPLQPRPPSSTTRHRLAAAEAHRPRAGTSTAPTLLATIEIAEQGLPRQGVAKHRVAARLRYPGRLGPQSLGRKDVGERDVVALGLTGADMHEKASPIDNPPGAHKADLELSTD